MRMRFQPRSKKTLMVIGILVALGAITLAGLVQAHPRLRANESSPSPGQLLSAPPKEVRLSFSVEDAGLVVDQSLAWVYREEGETVIALGRVDTNNAARNTITATLPANLAAGVYSVKWVAVSASDKGFSEGHYSFAIAGK